MTRGTASAPVSSFWSAPTLKSRLNMKTAGRNRWPGLWGHSSSGPTASSAGLTMFSRFFKNAPAEIGRQIRAKERSKMKRVMQGAILAVSLVVALLVPARSWAGGIKGKVSVQGIKSAENIVVYVDAIAGKKFDPPSEHVVIDHRRMAFAPH